MKNKEPESSPSLSKIDAIVFSEVLSIFYKIQNIQKLFIDAESSPLPSKVEETLKNFIKKETKYLQGCNPTNALGEITGNDFAAGVVRGMNKLLEEYTSQFKSSPDSPSQPSSISSLEEEGQEELWKLVFQQSAARMDFMQFLMKHFIITRKKGL